MRHPRRLAALPILAATLGVSAPQAQAATTAKITSRTLTVKGDGGDNRIALSATPDVLRIDVGDDGTADLTFRRDKFDRIDVRAGAGADSVRIDESGGVFTDTEATTIEGEGGADVLTGGSGPEVLDGGDGADLVNPRRGNDTVLLGAGDDVTAWAPGDASDRIEGQGGQDVLRFDAANIGESIALSANAGRLRLTRDVGAVVMDADDLERVEITARGGADTIAVGDLTGTDVKAVVPELGAADGAADTVLVDGTQGADLLRVTPAPGSLDPVVSGSAATVSVGHPEPALDQIVLRGAGGDDTVAVEGGDTADTLSVTPDGARVRVDRVAPAASTQELDSVEHLDVRGNGGDDTITAANGLATLIRLTADGGTGADTITGGDGGDVLRGGDGSDLVIPGRGNDTALLGAGDDTATWNPGDGNDTVEGEDGTDALAFNGANVSESIALSANAGRLRLTRDIAGIVMDADGVEQVDVAARGGTDSIAVGDLSGTAVTAVSPDLGAGDAAPDTVVADGTAAADAIGVGGVLGDPVVTGLAAATRVRSLEPGVDTLVVHARGGDDTITADETAGAPATVTVEGDEGDDTFAAEGGDAGDTLSVTPNGGRVRVDRLAPDASTQDLGTIEAVDLRGNGGDDTITAANGLATLIRLTADGGTGADSITGGDGADVLRGGDGSDMVTPGRGNDTALLGAGDDVARWNPGDGNDTVEGQDGSDVLAFNGANIGERVELSANGTRLRLTRDIAGIVMDADGVETVRYAALGGADTLAIGDLSGTAVTAVDADLAGTLGGAAGDAATDSVLVTGTDGDDAIAVAGGAGDVTVTGLAAGVHVGHAESTDALAIDSRAGADAVDESGLAPGTIQLSVS